VHLQMFFDAPQAWLDPALAEKWEKLRDVRRTVTGALELARAAKAIGSSLEAAPVVFITDAGLKALVETQDLAEIAITSGVDIRAGDGPSDAFRLDDVKGVSVLVEKASGIKCERSWKYFDPASADPEFPNLTPRDAKAMREWQAQHQVSA
jgi:isoleucyl-tRNA synthetase